MKEATRPSGRYALLDELRGLSLISMILYHGLWDLVFLYGVYGVWVPWYLGIPGQIWQQIGCWIFILLSGFCVQLSRHAVRRGLMIFGAGLLVTLVTGVFMPEDIVIFGILTFMGSAMILTGLLRPLFKKVPAWVGLIVSGILFFVTYNVNVGTFGFGEIQLGLVPAGWYANYFTTFLGFMHPGFYSTDYFSLFPWLFMYWMGFFLYDVVGKERMEPLRHSICRPLGWMGRHSLVIYLVHQPILYGLMTVLFSLL